MKKNEQKDKLMYLFWDMHIQFTPREIYSFLAGETKIDCLNRNRLLARMLSTLRWYDIIDIWSRKNYYFSSTRSNPLYLAQ